MGISLAQQAARILRRALTPDETARMERAASQGYTVAGRHYGDFTKDLPQKFDETGERAAFHLDPTPSGYQPLSRMGINDDESKFSTEVVLARLRNPQSMTDTSINHMRRGEKAGYQAEGSTGAYYPNIMETATSPRGHSPRAGRTLEDRLKAARSKESFAYEHETPQSPLMFNPSAAIFSPEDLRLFDAKFDPKNVGKVGWRGSATVPGMAGAGALGAAGASVMDKYAPKGPETPDPAADAIEPVSYDDAIMEVVQKLMGRMSK